MVCAKANFKLLTVAIADVSSVMSNLVFSAELYVTGTVIL